MHEESFNLVALPGAFLYVFGLVEIGLVLVVGHKEAVPGALVIAQRGCPLALAISILLILEVILVVILNYVVHIIDYAPVHQVFGMHDGGAGAEVHGGAYHVIVITHADDIRVRNIRISEGINGHLGTRFPGGSAAGQKAQDCQQAEGILHISRFVQKYR